MSCTSALLQLSQNTRPAYAPKRIGRTQCHGAYAYACIYICGVDIFCWQVSEGSIKLKLGGKGSQRASTNGMLSNCSPASLLRYGRQQAQAAIQEIRLSSNLQKALTQAHSTICRAPVLVQLLQEFASMSYQQLVPTVPVHLSLPTKCTRTAIHFHAQQSGSSPGVRSEPYDAYMLPP